MKSDYGSAGVMAKIVKGACGRRYTVALHAGGDRSALELDAAGAFVVVGNDARVERSRGAGSEVFRFGWRCFGAMFDVRNDAHAQDELVAKRPWSIRFENERGVPPGIVLAAQLDQAWLFVLIDERLYGIVEQQLRNILVAEGFPALSEVHLSGVRGTGTEMTFSDPVALLR